MSTLRRELTAILGDKARVERLLESRSLAREMDEIARKAQDVPPLSSMVPLTRAQREVASGLLAEICYKALAQGEFYSAQS